MIESKRIQSDGSPAEMPTPDGQQRDQSRREAIIRMAAYTTPVMLAMLTSEKAIAVSTGWYRKES
jgi:hypothetical protein